MCSFKWPNDDLYVCINAKIEEQIAREVKTIKHLIIDLLIKTHEET